MIPNPLVIYLKAKNLLIGSRHFIITSSILTDLKTALLSFKISQNLTQDLESETLFGLTLRIHSTLEQT